MMRPRLCAVDLTGSSRITDLGVVQMVSVCRHLRQLTLKCTRTSAASLGAVLSQLPLLQRLDLSYAWHLGDDAAAEAFTVIPDTLQHLALAGTGIGPASLAAIGAHARALRYLDVRDCDQVCRRHIETLCTALPQLHVVHNAVLYDESRESVARYIALLAGCE